MKCKLNTAIEWNHYNLGIFINEPQCFVCNSKTFSNEKVFSPIMHLQNLAEITRLCRASQVAQWVKNLPAMQADSLPTEPPGKPYTALLFQLNFADA